MATTANELSTVNNAIYSTLGDRWYDANDDPVALLRAESRLRNPWISDEVAKGFAAPSCSALDVGCGAGFLTNHLALEGHRVVGVDASAECLAVAAAHDRSRSVRYEVGDANHLAHPDASFEVVSAMDLLEHVENPRGVVAELARVLVPGGLAFFHTFNRNWLSWLIIIKGVEWFVKNTPRDMHILRLFLRPAEVLGWFREEGLELVELRGSRPVFNGAFFRMLATGVVPPDFRFRFTRSTALGYTGCVKKLAKGA